jgi:hypothetical protein
VPFKAGGKEAPLRVNPETTQAFRPESRKVDYFTFLENCSRENENKLTKDGSHRFPLRKDRKGSGIVCKAKDKWCPVMRDDNGSDIEAL